MPSDCILDHDDITNHEIPHEFISLIESSISPSILEPPSGRISESMRRASAVMLDLGEKRSRRSIIDVRNNFELSPLILQTSTSQGYDAITHEDYSLETISEMEDSSSLWKPIHYGTSIIKILHQIPAILLVCLLNLMVGIPFGVSYFPIGWSASNETNESGDGVSGPFPLPDRVALGIRMFLFSTIMGQLAFTFRSKFTNPIALQMVENVPFFHALAYIVIQEQGYGIDALSTLFFIFGLATLLVGAVFYILGKLHYGRIVYFFPSHVLVGCIGGIGVFIIVTAMEVTLNSPFTISKEGFWILYNRWNLFKIVLMYEVVLRVLDFVAHDKKGRHRFPLLSPLYFCHITPSFYLGLVIFKTSLTDAVDAGFFFPSLSTSQSDANPMELLEIFQIINFRTISWAAVIKSLPTMVALAAFSLIHVPINIPAFGISTDVDTDMNAELIAHGWSNFLSGLFGGIQNYMTYSNSVMYAKSGGQGKISSLMVVFLTCILFVVGPNIANYIPRCMAGTLLLHIGIDLVLEGLWDSFGNYDRIEYLFIWVITIVMTSYGMTAALIAGIIAAMSTYAAQSIANANPIRGIMTASTLRGSAWNRSKDALRILDDPEIGRSRILLIKLQGHLFFGNVAQITDQMKIILHEKKGKEDEPWIVIMDFTLVVGMDSSAAHAIAKLKKIMHKAFGVEVSIFVTGSGDGFPCEYALSLELSKAADDALEDIVAWNDESFYEISDDAKHASVFKRGSVSVSMGSAANNANFLLNKYPKGRVCESLDAALIFAEDMLVLRGNPEVLENDKAANACVNGVGDLHFSLSMEEERDEAFRYLKNLCPQTDDTDVELLLSYFHREEYFLNDMLWDQDQPSECAKLLVSGALMSYLEGTDTSEGVAKGNMVGELGLVHGTARFSKLVCISEKAILYSLSKERWNEIVKTHPHLARLMDCIVIRYLAHRVQHVSNRIFETRCLPI
jgi:sulfate permease, SulP family